MDIMDDVIQHFQSLLGKKTKVHLGEVSALLIRRYALSVGETNPLYFDAEFARKQGFQDVIAPPNLLASVMEWGVGEDEAQLSRDGMPQASEFLPEHVTGVRVMGGGEEMSFYHPVEAGTRVTLVSEVVDTYSKVGSKGKIAFLVFKNTYMDQDERVLCVCNRTVIAR